MRKLPVYLLFMVAAFAAQPLFGQHPHSRRVYYEEDAAPRAHKLDMTRAVVELAFEPEKRLVKGRVTHEFEVLRERVDSVFFDAPGINIQEAALDGRPVKFTTDAKGVTVHFDRPLKWDETGAIAFRYTATPRKGVYFIGWNDPKNISRKQIWTQGQGIDHRHWIPAYDDANDKLITETITTFDKAYRVLSNGELKSVKNNGDGTKTWHYAMTKPHSFYLLMLGIGKYNVKTLETESGVPVHLWYYPGDEDKFEPTYRYSTECIDFMEKHTGIPYPWESYSQIPVQDFIYGAMENTTATIFGDFFVVDKREFHDRNYIGVNVHELTHQWYGDYITHRSPNQIWLHESFATFYPKLFFREIYGQEYYQWQRRGERRSALNASKRNDFPIVSTKGGVARVYPKGSAVLDMMFYVFGEDACRRVFRHYLQRHAYANVETNDLYQSFQDTLGLSPDWFFDQWLYAGGEPHYKISYEALTVGGKAYTDVTVEQIHETDQVIGLFRMPVVLEAHYPGGGKDSVRVWVEEKRQTIRIPNTSGGEEPAFVLFDPEGRILKQVTFDRSPEELKAQALNAPHMIDRYDAVKAMEDLPADAKRETLLQVFQRKGEFHAVKSEVVRQLAKDGHPLSVSLLKAAAEDPDIEVHKAVANNVDSITPELRPAFESFLTDSSYNLIVTALDKLCAQYPERADAYLRATKGFTGNDHRVAIKRREIMAGRGDDKAVEALKFYASNSYEFRTRQRAMQAIQRLNYLDAELCGHLFQAAADPNRRLAAVAISTLKYFKTQNDYANLIRASYNPDDWNETEQGLIEGVVE